ncbi:hypothetical protein D3C80_1493960 [compost metagenome]
MTVSLVIAARPAAFSMFLSGEADRIMIGFIFFRRGLNFSSEDSRAVAGMASPSISSVTADITSTSSLSFTAGSEAQTSMYGRCSSAMTISSTTDEPSRCFTDRVRWEPSRQSSVAHTWPRLVSRGMDQASSPKQT